MHTDTLSLVGLKLSSMLQEKVFSLQNVKLELPIEHQTIPMFHGLLFLQLGVLLLDLYGWLRILKDHYIIFWKIKLRIIPYIIFFYNVTI